MSDGDSTIAAALLLELIFLIGGMFLAASQRDELKEEAVKRGFAEWTVKSDGTTKWMWKEVQK